MVIVSRCWDGVMREDGAQAVTWPGILCWCTPGSHRAGRAGHIVMSRISSIHQTLSAHAAHTHTAWAGRVFACLESFYISHIRELRVPSSLARAHILLCPVSCLASSDAIYAFLDQAQPSLPHQASSEAKQQNTSVFGKYTR